MRVSQGVWHIGFRDGQDRQQDIAGFTHEGQTRFLASRIQTLVGLCGEPMPSELKDFIDRLPNRIKVALEEWGLIKARPQPEAEPEPQRLAEWVDEFESCLRTSKGRSGYRRNAVHVQTTVSRIRAIVDGCHFMTWADISKAAVERLLGGLSVKNPTYNGYVGAFKHFCTWLVENQRVEFSPVQYLGRVNVPDKEKRRPLGFDEVCRLLRTAQNSPERRYGLSGPERGVLYLLAIQTGFRRNELAHLTAGCFDLNKATVKLDAAFCKDRRDAQQPITMALASRLAGFLAGKAPTEPIFNLKTPRTALMIQADAIEAGLPLTDDEGRELVFHSLRHTLRTELTRARVSEAIIDHIMRHKPVGVGRRFYGHVTEFEKREAVERLPDYPWPGDLQQQAVKTGTDDAPELYGQVYADVTLHHTTPVNIRQITPDNGPTTALATRNQGLARTG